MDSKESIESKLTEYYSNGNYRGFHKIKENTSKLTGVTKLMFSNGKKQIYTSGSFREEALSKMFKKVDNLE